MKPSILVVADDAALRATLARWLMAAGYALELAEGPKRAREVIAKSDIALAIVAPDGLGASGGDLARELDAQVGRVILIAGHEPLGESPSRTDGSISRPLNEQDVLARVTSALGAAPTRDERAAPHLIRFEGYTLDADGHTCLDANGHEVALTRAEFSLLLSFVRQPGRVLSRDELTRAVAGRDAEPDDRSIDVLISRLRRKIEPDPKAPRLIVTVPGAGYKLTGNPQTTVLTAPAAPPLFAVAPIAEASQGVVQAAQGQETRDLAPLPRQRRPIGGSRMAAIGAAAVASAAGLVIAFWYPGYAIKGTAGPGAPRQIFDAAVIPLINDMARQDLAGYATRPDVKALAISSAGGNGWGMAFGDADVEAAKKEALDRCSARSAGRICRIYAVGMDVVWSPASLPLPSPVDIHAEPLDASLLVAEIPLQTDARRQEITEKYLPLRTPHKAIAVVRQGFLWSGGNSRPEAVRLTVERCGDYYQAPCLLLSVDGSLTIEIPKSRPIEDIFMLSTAPEMSEADRQRIAQVYAGKDWRALAKGQSGGWYAVAGHETEAAAVDAALKACSAAEPECVLYAIGNWRVGVKLDPNRG